MREPYVGSRAKLNRQVQSLLNSMSNLPALGGAPVQSLFTGEAVTEEVAVTNGNVILAGSLTMPFLDGLAPAVFLVGGGDRQDRDGARASIPGYRPYAMIAERLSRYGFAVLRCDTRGVGKSTGNNATATESDFLSDSEAAIECLRTRPGIAINRVGVLGLSEGALIAPLLAGKNPHVAFVISAPGYAASGRTLLLRSREREAAAEGKSPEEVAQLVQEQRQILDLSLAGNGEALTDYLKETTLKHLLALPADKRAAFGDLEAAAEKKAAESAKFLQGPRFQWFLAHDFGEDWARVSVPVFALFGELDLRCDAAQNQLALKQALARGGNTNLQSVVLPAADHLFLRVRTGSRTEYATSPREFARGFLESITVWLLSRKSAPHGTETKKSDGPTKTNMNPSPIERRSERRLGRANQQVIVGQIKLLHPERSCRCQVSPGTRLRHLLGYNSLEVYT
jgi:uncharacterized protein